MQFVRRKILGASCLCVDSWEAQGFCHGFFGVEMDVEALPSIELLNDQSVSIQLLNQVHSIDIHSTPGSGSDGTLEGDGWCGLVDSERPWAAAVKTADCIPVLLWNSIKRFGAVLHCGRKGTIDGLLLEALKLFDNIGCEVEETEIAIGPGVSGECYEIGQDLACEIRTNASKHPGLFLEGMLERNGSYFLDLKAMLVEQALGQGVRRSKILVSDICTICSKEFHSYRRDNKAAGRQITLMGSDAVMLHIRPV